MNNSFKNSLNNNEQNINKWCARLAYKCGICDKEHDSIQKRAECELSCLRKKEEEERLAAEKKRVEEQRARKAEVDKAVDKANELIDKYVEDYGVYRYDGIFSMIDEDEYMSLRDFMRMLPQEALIMEEIRIVYHNKSLGKIEALEQGDWIDLRASETVEMSTGDFRLISLGVSMKLPEGYEAHLAPRSSTFKKWGITQVNSIGM